MPDAIKTPAEAMNEFSRRSSEINELKRLIAAAVAPFETRIKLLEETVAKLNKKAPKGEESK